MLTYGALPTRSWPERSIPKYGIPGSIVAPAVVPAVAQAGYGYLSQKVVRSKLAKPAAPRKTKSPGAVGQPGRVKKI